MTNYADISPNSQKTRELALALEKYQQRQARQFPPKTPSLVEFFEKTSPYKAEPWQVVLCNRLEKLKTQKGQRIKIHKPPQRGGSLIVSQRLSPYLIGCNPNLRVRLITFNETHSQRFSATMINTINSPEYRELFPSVVVPQRSSVGEWSTSVRETFNDGQPTFIALGLASGIVGTGGDLWVIDDPYKNRDEAFSEVINDKIRWSYQENIRPRMAPEDNIIVMYHRWHEDDLAGFLDNEGDWEDIRIPDICDSENDFCGRMIGEALSPRYPIESLLRLRDGYTNDKGEFVAGIGEAVFESLHQGNPKPRGGIRFKEEWLQYVDEFPRDGGKFLSYTDLASSGKPTADQTAVALWYKSTKGKYYLVDCRGKRLEPNERNNWMLNTFREWKEQFGIIEFNVEEPPGAGKEVAESVCTFMHNNGISVWKDKPRKDKEARAGLTEELSVTDSLVGHMQAGNVLIVRGEWNKPWRTELLSFPKGKHDDLVDASVSGFNLIVKYKIFG